jgi:uncharacterized protein (DUF1330 family)
MTRLFLTSLLVLVWSVPLHSKDKSKPNTAKPAGADKAAPRVGGARADENRVFELRTYHLNEGKLDDLHKRFRDHTCSLLKKHGAELIGFWTPVDEDKGKGSKLIYLVAFPSREAAKKTWDDFGNDPEWKKVYEESHKNGKLVKSVDSVFMEPTDYSAMK